MHPPIQMHCLVNSRIFCSSPNSFSSAWKSSSDVFLMDREGELPKQPSLDLPCLLCSTRFKHSFYLFCRKRCIYKLHIFTFDKIYEPGNIGSILEISDWKKTFPRCFSLKYFDDVFTYDVNAKLLSYHWNILNSGMVPGPSTGDCFWSPSTLVQCTITISYTYVTLKGNSKSLTCNYSTSTKCY